MKLSCRNIVYALKSQILTCDSKQIMLAKTKKKSFRRPKGFVFNKIVNQELQAELNTMENLKIKTSRQASTQKRNKRPNLVYYNICHNCTGIAPDFQSAASTWLKSNLLRDIIVALAVRQKRSWRRWCVNSVFFLIAKLWLLAKDRTSNCACVREKHCLCLLSHSSFLLLAGVV